jgi:N-succinyldiaminopimelate aminotransferase
MDLSGPWQDAARGANLWTPTGPSDPEHLLGGMVQPTIFARMSGIAQQLGAPNLGQGFPDTQPPAVVAETAAAAIREGNNQYPPGPGTPVLREAIAAHQQRFYGMDVDPATEVLVTTGATEAIAAAILALVRPGDEVLTLEPFYDSYAATIALAGGVHRTVGLTTTVDENSDLVLGVDPGTLRAAITDKTRLILVNTPHNPTGLVLGTEALQVIVDGAREHDALIMSDEVYEHLTFGAPHVPIATLPGAAERTITIGSAGKTFSVTGWKIGWAIARPEVITAVTAVKQWLTFTSGAPFQPAVAAGLGMDDAAYAAIAEDLRVRRDRLLTTLREVGLRVSVPEAGYFVVADATPLGEPDAAALCERLPQEAGVVAIPVSAFHLPATLAAPDSPARSLVRFAFCKDDATLAEADRRLRAWARERRPR